MTEETQDPFMKARAMMNAGADKVKESINKLITRKRTEKDVFDEYVAELKADAGECEQYFKDERYIRGKKFMDGLRAGFSSVLERLSANGAFNQIEIARIGAKIELLDQIRNRPADLIKELERVNKKS
jgi:predicted CopG family antitoxin